MNQSLPPDGTGESREKAHIEKIPVEEAVKEAALQKIRDAVEGNGFDPEKIVIKSFEGELLKFTAETVLNIRSKVNEKIVAGRVSGPKACDTPGALAQMMENEYKTFIGSRDMIRKVREVVLNRNDKGFAQDDLVIPLTFWHKDFVRYEPCGNCRGDGKIQCARCHGLGWEVCPQCHKSGMIVCHVCNGAQNIQTPNGPQRCTQCHGRGNLQCPRCQQKGEIHCSKCKTKGHTTCTQCQGHAVNSRVSVQSMDIRTEFTYDKEVVPDKVASLMERLGSKLDQHAVIELSQQQDHEDENELQEKIALHYNVSLPYGHIEFTLGNETSYAFLFGHKAKLTYVSNFLDKLIANGARKLKDAAEERGDVAANLQAAAKFRTAKQAIIAAARYPAGRAMKALKKAHIMGLSDEMVKTLIADATRALQNISHRPGMIGLAGGLLLAGIINAVWFLIPLRGAFTGMVANNNLYVMLDMLVAGIAAGLAALSVQAAGAGAIRKALKGIVPAGKEGAFMPKLGRNGLYAIGGALLIFAIMLEMSLQGGSAPNWYTSIR